MSKRNRNLDESVEGLEEIQATIDSGEELSEEQMDTVIEMGMDVGSDGALVMSENVSPEEVLWAVKAGRDINTLVSPGKKGVTNAQMIPAMKLAVDEQDLQALDLLKQYYAEVFHSSIKYIGKDRQIKILELGYN